MLLNAIVEEGVPKERGAYVVSRVMERPPERSGAGRPRKDEWQLEAEWHWDAEFLDAVHYWQEYYRQQGTPSLARAVQKAGKETDRHLTVEGYKAIRRKWRRLGVEFPK